MKTAGPTAAPRGKRALRNFRRNAAAGMKLLGRDIWRDRVSYLFLLPFAVVFLAFTVVPVMTAMYYSFTYYNILESPQWVGWQNYTRLFLADDLFPLALKNTFLFALLTGPVGYLASFVMAWLVNEQKRALRVFLTVVLYAPVLSGQIYVIWNVIFSGDIYGFANGVLLDLGLIDAPVQWLTNSDTIMAVCVIVVLWLSLGTNFLIFLAGLQNMQASYYEAGMIDGIRNRWQELWYITLPQMKPQLMLGAVMAITGAFSIHDVLVPLVGFPSADYAAHTLVSHITDFGTVRYDMGYACSIAVFLFLLMMVSNKAVQALLRKVGK